MQITKHSGRKAYRKILEDMGYKVSDEEVNAVYAIGNTLADKVKKMVKEQGYVAAAKIAKLREGEFMDSEEMRFIRGAFELEGIKKSFPEDIRLKGINKKDVEYLKTLIRKWKHKEKHNCLQFF